jgi:5-methylcytosine-specific restriction protein B
VQDFSAALKEAHISFGAHHDRLVRSFVASLATKAFVILTGLSGSGKTQVALRFGDWLGEARRKLIPVRPDWTGSEALFGFEDALQPAKPDGRRVWHVPEALEFMLTAAADPHNPYLLILDEMNLAHVERYFADVLSGMESGDPVLPNLHKEEDGLWRQVPDVDRLLAFPRNLFVVGTVNVDETTYMFSPKVLDRANVFEFRVGTTDLQTDLRKPVACRAGDDGVVQSFLGVAVDDRWHLDHPAPAQSAFASQLREVHALLGRETFEFGFRVFYEANRFAAIIAAAGDGDQLAALDLQLMQKVLPRLHGSRRRLEPVLKSLGVFALQLSTDPVAIETFDPMLPTEQSAMLPMSFDKIHRMTQTLRANQFASFTE